MKRAGHGAQVWPTGQQAEQKNIEKDQEYQSVLKRILSLPVRLRRHMRHKCVCVSERASERATERERERVRVFEIFDMNALKMDLPPLKRAMALYK